MSLTREDVSRIGRLARIALSADEEQRVLGQLNGILGLIDELNAVSTEGVTPMSHAQDLAQRLRADQVTETDRRDALMANAPQRENGLFPVPKVIE